VVIAWGPVTPAPGVVGVVGSRRQAMNADDIPNALDSGQHSMLTPP
jgi:hypothetical protein